MTTCQHVISHRLHAIHRWKQLLDEWSADDLLGNTLSESSTNLLPSSNSAAISSVPGYVDAAGTVGGGDATRTRPGSSTSDNVDSDGDAYTEQMAEGSVQQQTQQGSQQQQQQLAGTSPERTPVQAAVNPLFSPGEPVLLACLRYNSGDCTGIPVNSTLVLSPLCCESADC